MTKTSVIKTKHYTVTYIHAYIVIINVCQ